MKHFIIFLLTLILSACASSKKANVYNKVETSVDSSSATDKVVKRSSFDIDTSKVNEWGMKITEIEFYPPSIDDANAMHLQSNSNANASKSDADASMRHPRFGSTGGVKKMKQTIIGSCSINKGTTKNAELTDSTKQSLRNRRNDATTIKEQTKTKCNVNWWIASAIFASIVLLYLKRVPMMNVIRKILTAIRRIL